MGMIEEFLSASDGREHSVVACRLFDLRDTSPENGTLHERATVSSEQTLARLAGTSAGVKQTTRRQLPSRDPLDLHGTRSAKVA